MTFNSILFIAFLCIVFSIHWGFFSKNPKRQNIFLLASSLFFYAGWDYRFLSLILFSTVLDYFVGIAIYNQAQKRNKKALLALSVFVNLGLLFVFKYFNFFIDSFNEFSNILGFQTNFKLLNIILPVGISFYTFQTLSYTIDIYNTRLKPTKDWVHFAAYVCFFPQLVARFRLLS